MPSSTVVEAQAQATIRDRRSHWQRIHRHGLRRQQMKRWLAQAGLLSVRCDQGMVPVAVWLNDRVPLPITLVREIWPGVDAAVARIPPGQYRDTNREGRWYWLPEKATWSLGEAPLWLQNAIVPWSPTTTLTPPELLERAFQNTVALLKAQVIDAIGGHGPML